MSVPGSILVAVSDSAASRAAVAAAAALARSSGAEVLAVHVWCHDAPCCGPSAEACGLRDDDGSLEKALDRLRAAGVRCRGERWRALDGRVVRSLIEAADQNDADVVFAGSGRRRWPPWLRPGIGLQLARRCARPVLLIAADGTPSRP